MSTPNTPQKPPIQNKPLLITVIVIAAAVAFGIASYVSQHGLTRDKALAQAIPLMKDFCARACASQGVTEADLVGPTEPARNREAGNTKFDFTWTAHDKVLLVRIWDNGLAVQNMTQWEPSPQQANLPH